MRYISTRGQAEVKDFCDVVTSGLASDGGLYMPEEIPHFTIEEIKSWKRLSYNDLAFKVMSHFVDGEISDNELKKIIFESYSNFNTPNITEIIELEKDIHIQELFHGPTLAFKDVALQFLGKLQDHILSNRNQDIIIIGATSGDTGSAAIEGVKNCRHVKIFMLHPSGKVSPIQQRQMTTIISENVFNIAVESHFDDCQDMVKEMFKNPEFIKGKRLSAVNSINWARIMAQIVYYFQAVLKLTDADKAVTFAVPSGNFGDVLAGYIAKKMGLPVDQLIVTTNKNDILHRFFTSNDYSKQSVCQTVAPSMDIQVSSNFERLLFLEYKNDSSKVSKLMESLKSTGKLSVDKDVFRNITKTFRSHSSNDEEIKSEIKRVYKKYKYIVCPHTATATHSIEKFKREGVKLVVLATASPAKFPAVVKESIDIEPKLPVSLSDLMQRREKFVIMPNDINQIKNYIYQNS